MNGLEAIKLMEQGKMVSTKKTIISEVIISKIENNKVYWLFDYELEDNNWKEEDSFDFTLDYEEYIEHKTLTGWERVDEGIEKYFLQSGGYVMGDIEGNIWFDDDYYEIANYFSTKEKAEEVHFKQTLFRKLQRFSDENDGDKIDWNSGIQGKYHIYFDYFSKELKVQSYYECRDLFQVYFISEEVTKKAIELFHDELIKYFKGEY